MTWGAFEFSEAQARPTGCFSLLRADPDVEFSATLAPCLPT